MSCVPQLLRAELLKIRSSRTTWVLLGCMAALTCVVVLLTLGSLEGDELAGSRGIRRVLTIGGSLACYFTLAHGILGMTSEYRHGTLGQAFVAAPARWPVVVAKVIAHVAVGLAFGLVALGVTFAVGLPGLAAEDSAVSYGGSLPPGVVLGSLVSAALFAAIGVGLAALLRDQSLALGAGLGWTLLVDSLVNGIEPAVGRFLPAGTVPSLVRSHTQEVLTPGVAAVVLLAYALAFVGAGALALRRRDLT